MTSRSCMTMCVDVVVFGVGVCTPERGGPMHDVQHISVYIARPNHVKGSITPVQS